MVQTVAIVIANWHGRLSAGAPPAQNGGIMWATTFSVIRNNAVIVVGFLVFDTLIDIFSREAASYLWLWTLVSIWLFAYYIHRAVLFEERFDLAGLIRPTFLRQFGKFFWRSICLSLLLGLIAIIVSIPIFVAIGGVRIRENPTAVIAMVALFLVVVPVVYAWLGTWLPATVYGQASSFAEARSRGKTTFLPVLLDLVIPTAIGPIASILQGAGILAQYLPVQMQFHGTGDDYFPIFLVIVGHGLQLIVTAMYAVALSRAYQNSLGKTAWRIQVEILPDSGLDSRTQGLTD
jgi:hypothetical protein